MVLNKMNYGEMIGIEIECFIPSKHFDTHRNDSCSDCDGSGETICSDCDEYHECGSCEGSGTSGSGSSSPSSRTIDEFQRMIDGQGIEGVDVTDDGSLEHDEYNMVSFELRVLTSIKSMDNLKRLCTYINSLGAEVNNSCGLHVHLDCRDLKGYPFLVLERGKRLFNSLNILQQIVSPSRLDNNYCKLEMTNLSKYSDRYAAINLTSFNTHSTIEVRLHQGTTNFKKISYWARLLYRVSRNKTMTDMTFETPNRFYLANKIPLIMREYFNSRIEKFNTAFTKADQTAEIAGVLRIDREAS